MQSKILLAGVLFACVAGCQARSTPERVAETSGAMVSGNMVSGNMVSGNMVSGNMVSGNMVRGTITSGYTAGTLFATPIQVGAFVDPEDRKLVVVSDVGADYATIDASQSELFWPDGAFDTDYETYFCYLVKGALRDDQAVVVTNRPDLPDRKCPGHIGINPDWLGVRGMTTEESLEMVAMMAAHSNDGHTSVPISVRADAPVRVTADADEQGTFFFDEATFFLGVDDAGNNEIQFCAGDVLQMLIDRGDCTGEGFAKRFCTEELWSGGTPCFHYVGACDRPVESAPPSTPGKPPPVTNLCAERLDDGVMTDCDNDLRSGEVGSTHYVFSVFLNQRVHCDGTR